MSQTPNSPALPPAVLDEYLAGRCSSGEREQVEQHFSMTRMEVIQALDAALHAEAGPLDHFRDRERGRLSAAMARASQAQRRPQLTRTSVPPARSRRARWAFVACGVVALCAGVATLYPTHAPTPRTPLFYTTTVGQRATVPMGEGSSVMLAPATTVRIYADSVVVRGEAYFTVAPSAKRALMVRTSNATVQVLGTKFTVRQYPTEPASRVAVEDGRVMVRALYNGRPSHLPLVLAAGTLGQVTDSGVVRTSEMTVDDYTAWTRGQLVFNDVPLRDVVTELGRVYGSEIRVSDSVLARQPITIVAAFTRQPLTQLLDFMSRAAEAHYTHSGNTFVLLPGRASSPTKPAPRQREQQSLQPESQYGR